MTQSSTMSPRKSYQSADDLRRALMERVDLFCRLTGTSRSKLGLEALNDNHSIRQIESGRDIRLDTYQRLMSHMDEKWPHDAPSLAAENLEKENG